MSRPVNSREKCFCGCGLTFITSASRKYAPECKTSSWKRYQLNQIRYRVQPEKRYRSKGIPKPRKYPLHKCSRPGCPNRTTKQFLCQHCYVNHAEFPEVRITELITLTPKLREHMNAITDKQREELSRKVTIYSADNYSQEELRAVLRG